eukprot:4475294-Pyramimonas_sp.AAC.1
MVGEELSAARDSRKASVFLCNAGVPNSGILGILDRALKLIHRLRKLEFRYSGRLSHATTQLMDSLHWRNK